MAISTPSFPSFSVTPQSSSRRRFLKTATAAGVVTFVGTGLATPWQNPMTAWALPGGGNDTVVVSVFLRGAADGLNIVVPHGDDAYYAARGTYARNAGQYNDLDGFFGLNVDFNALMPLWNEGKMAAVNAVGSHETTRSHFVAQPNMESGLGLGGWMQRAIGASDFANGSSGLSIGDRTSPQLMGPFSGAVINTVQDTIDAGVSLSVVRPALEALYQGAGAQPLESGAVLGALATIDDVSGIGEPNPGEFPNTNFSRDLSEAATLIKADIGVRAVAVDSVGWDHHSDGTARMIRDGGWLSEGIAAFIADLGSHASRVLVCVSSEFGRELDPEGADGTDHGHGTMMLVFGDALAGQGGGKVLVPGGWPGLDLANLYQGRDLAITTDFRSVYAEIAERHLDVEDTDAIFPGFARQDVGLLRREGDADGSGQVDASDVQNVLDGNITTGANIAADLDNDGDVDLTDALLLAQRVGGN